MFRDLGTTAVPALWYASLRAALTDRLGRDVAAFVTVDGADLPVAVAIGVVDQRLPSPRRPTGRIGYVEWLATDPEQRRRGAARMALIALLHWFDGQGITTVDVHASEAARPLYLDLGFAAPAAMPLRRSR
jgi:GNAT superfamily N-acetyltransferase